MRKVSLVPYETVKDIPFGEDIEISLKQSNFKDTMFKDGKTTFAFENCYFWKLGIVNSEEIDFSSITIGFFGCYIEEITIKEIASKNISVVFFGCILTGMITAANLHHVEITNCLLNRTLFLMNFEKLKVGYTKSLNLDRWKAMFRGIFVLEPKNMLSAKQTFFASDLREIDFGTQLENEGKRRTLDINLNIAFSKENTDIKTDIMNAFLKSLHISGPSQGKISVESSKINDWYMYDFSPRDEVSFYNVTPDSANADNKIGIHRCNLDNAWFDNVYFNQYKFISFYRTKFSKATFTSCDFPDSYKSFQRFMPIENVHYPEQRSKSYPKELYEIFLQLKKALEATGNYYESQKLQAISYDALREVKAIPNTDRIILLVNYLSNNHGLSIKRPFLAFIIVTPIFYILYLCSLGKMFISWDIDWKLVGYYFSFIDITHRTDFLVSKEDFTGWSQFIDYLNKLAMGFLIYQFIASFRKYGKK